MSSSPATFTTARDADYGYIVLERAGSARSFAMVPIGHTWAFDTKAEATTQALLLSAMGNVATRMVETPERFEEVADTRYGAAW